MMIPDSLRKYVYYEEPDIVLLHGDCLNMLPHFEPESIDLVLTDPPYNASGSKVNWLEKGFAVIDQIWDYNYTPDFAPPAFQTLKHGGGFLCFCSYHTIHMYTSMAKPQQILHWAKNNPFPAIAKVYTPSIEYIVWWTRGNPYTFNKKEAGRDIITTNICAGSEREQHPTQKPLELIAKLLKVHSNQGETILDPFLGSGTTAVACKQLGRKCIGIELESKYLDIAIERLRQEVLF
jgi:DNA modification methylase